MKPGWTSALTACLLLTSQAALAGNRQAQDSVSGLKKEHAAFLERYPAASPIDAAVRENCAAQNKGKLATDDFCGCAAAVTIGLWRSGVDPNMVPRLTAYLSNPTEDGAKEFLKFQGPELYRRLCSLAGKR